MLMFLAMPGNSPEDKPNTPEESSDSSILNKKSEFISYLPEDLQHTARTLGELTLQHGHESVLVQIGPYDTARVYYPPK